MTATGTATSTREATRETPPAEPAPTRESQPPEPQEQTRPEPRADRVDRSAEADSEPGSWEGVGHLLRGITDWARDSGEPQERTFSRDGARVTETTRWLDDGTHREVVEATKNDLSTRTVTSTQPDGDIHKVREVSRNGVTHRTVTDVREQEQDITELAPETERFDEDDNVPGDEGLIELGEAGATEVASTRSVLVNEETGKRVALDEQTRYTQETEVASNEGAADPGVWSRPSRGQPRFEAADWNENGDNRQTVSYVETRREDGQRVDRGELGLDLVNQWNAEDGGRDMTTVEGARVSLENGNPVDEQWFVENQGIRNHPEDYDTGDKSRHTDDAVNSHNLVSRVTPSHFEEADDHHGDAYLEHIDTPTTDFRETQQFTFDEEGQRQQAGRIVDLGNYRSPDESGASVQVTLPEDSDQAFWRLSEVTEEAPVTLERASGRRKGWHTTRTFESQEGSSASLLSTHRQRLDGSNEILEQELYDGESEDPTASYRTCRGEADEGQQALEADSAAGNAAKLKRVASALDLESNTVTGVLGTARVLAQAGDLDDGSLTDQLDALSAVASGAGDAAKGLGGALRSQSSLGSTGDLVSVAGKGFGAAGSAVTVGSGAFKLADGDAAGLVDVASGASGLAALAPGMVGTAATGVGATLALGQLYFTLDGLTRDSHTPVDPTL